MTIINYHILEGDTKRPSTTSRSASDGLDMATDLNRKICLSKHVKEKLDPVVENNTPIIQKPTRRVYIYLAGD